MARIGGAFPLALAQIIEGGGLMSLPGGGIFYPPPGQYLFTSGYTTVLEWWDPIQQQWRVYGPVGARSLQVTCDGYNMRIINASGIVTGANITNAGSGGVNGIGATATGVTVSFGAAPSNGVAATAYAIVGGQINSTITITAGGSGYLVPPILLIDPPPPGGIQATAVCTISAGAINAVTVTNQGAGYTSAPTVTVIPQFQYYAGGPSGSFAVAGVGIGGSSTAVSGTPGGSVLPNNVGLGSGAVLTVNATLAGTGTVTGIVPVQQGVGYTGTTIPTITITGAGAAAATAIMSMSLSSITITSGGVAYGTNTPMWSSNGGSIAKTNNNNALMMRQAFGGATLSGGAVNATTIDDPGFGFQTVPLLTVTQSAGTPATTLANLTAVVGGINDVFILQPRINE